MTTLYASVIQLTCQNSAVLPRSGGQYGHAVLLDIVRSVDAQLAQALHDADRRNPFTVSPLFDLPPASQGVVAVRPGWRCWMRVTILDEKLFQTFIARFLYGNARPSLRLGEASFLVTEILTTPGSHAWAGYTTLEELRARLEQFPPARFELQLETPTAFSLGGSRVATLPLAELVFANLGRAWQRLGGEDQVKPLRQYCQENLLVGAYDLKTQAMHLFNRPQLGAVGRVEYVRLEREDCPEARWLGLLADLAFYTGVGRKTGMGMGQCRRVLW